MKSDMSQNHSPCLIKFGQELRRRRKGWGMSQQALAKKCGVTQSTIAHIEAGTGNPTVQTLESIAMGLQQDLSIKFTLFYKKNR